MSPGGQFSLALDTMPVQAPGIGPYSTTDDPRARANRRTAPQAPNPYRTTGPGTSSRVLSTPSTAIRIITNLARARVRGSGATRADMSNTLRVQTLPYR